MTGLSRLWAFLAVAAFAVAVLGAFRVPIVDADEPRFAQASAQMLESGDFIRLYYLDAPRHKKPVGAHWLQAASVAAVSSAPARKIFAYRLPSLLGLILAMLAVWRVGRLYGVDNAGVAAAALLGAAILPGFEAHLAKTDACLLGASAIGVWGLAKLAKEQRGAMLLWGGLGAGVLIKGPIAPLVLLPAAALVWRSQRSPDFRRALLKPAGVLFALAIAAPWFIAVQIATGGAFASEALAEDFLPKLTSAHEGNGAPPFSHFVLAPLFTWPTAFAAPLAIIAAIKLWRSAPPPAGSDPIRQLMQVLVFAIAPAWAAFELVPTKLPHYPLPLYPWLILLSVVVLRDLKVLTQSLCIGASLFIGFGLVFAGIAIAPPSAPSFTLFGSILAVVLLVASFAALMARAPPRALALLVAGAVAWQAGLKADAPHVRLDGALVFGLAERALDKRATLCAPQPNDRPLLIFGTMAPSLAFLARGHLRFIDHRASEAVPNGVDVLHIDDGGDEDAQRWRRFKARQEAPFPAPDATIDGFDLSRSRRVVASLYCRMTISPGAQPS